MAELKTIEVQGAERVHVVQILVEPPPHMLFLASELQSANMGSMEQFALGGGIAACVIRTLNGEPMHPQKLPRTQEELLALGRGCILDMYDAVGSYADLNAISEAIMAAYQGDAANPT